MKIIIRVFFLSSMDNVDVWRKYFQICVSMDKERAYSGREMRDLIRNIVGVRTGSLIDSHLAYMVRQHFVNVSFDYYRVNVNIDGFYKDFLERVSL